MPEDVLFGSFQAENLKKTIAMFKISSLEVVKIQTFAEKKKKIKYALFGYVLAAI